MRPRQRGRTALPGPRRDRGRQDSVDGMDLLHHFGGIDGDLLKWACCTAKEVWGRISQEQRFFYFPEGRLRFGRTRKLDRDPAVLLSGSAISPRPIARNRRRLVRKKASRTVECGKPAAPAPFIAVARERKTERPAGVGRRGKGMVGQPEPDLQPLHWPLPLVRRLMQQTRARVKPCFAPPRNPAPENNFC